jgi:leukotriene-A4 hydrolase
MQAIARDYFKGSFLKCGRFRSAYATTELRPRTGRCFTSRSPALKLFLSTYTSSSTSLGKHRPSVKHMGGGPTLPSRFSTTTMHRAPAAMVTKPLTDPDIQIKTPRDPNTLSNYHNYVTRHTSVDFEIDFEKKRLTGSVVLRLESLVDEGEVDVVLDSRYVNFIRRRHLSKFIETRRAEAMYGITNMPIASSISQKSR